MLLKDNHKEHKLLQPSCIDVVQKPAPASLPTELWRLPCSGKPTDTLDYVQHHRHLPTNQIQELNITEHNDLFFFMRGF